jgi:hypothetical protein
MLYVVDLQYGRGLSPHLPAKRGILGKRLTVRTLHSLYTEPKNFNFLRISWDIGQWYAQT